MNYESRYLKHLELIPLLGPVRIKKLITTFKEPEWLFNATIAELCRVDGFSEKLAQKVYDGLRDNKLRVTAYEKSRSRRK